MKMSCYGADLYSPLFLSYVVGLVSLHFTTQVGLTCVQLLNVYNESHLCFSILVHVFLLFCFNIKNINFGINITQFNVTDQFYLFIFK